MPRKAKPWRGEVRDRLGVERLDGLEAEPGHAAGHDPVLDVDRGDPPGLEHAQQLGRQDSPSARQKCVVVVGVAEVVVARRVLVLRGERDRRDDQVDACRRPCARLLDGVGVDEPVAVAGDLAPLDADRPRAAPDAIASRGQPVLADDRAPCARPSPRAAPTSARDSCGSRARPRCRSGRCGPARSAGSAGCGGSPG